MGHEMGDAYIRSFADQLYQAIPDDQFAGRDGGDEFIAIIKIQKAVLSMLFF